MAKPAKKAAARKAAPGPKAQPAKKAPAKAVARTAKASGTAGAGAKATKTAKTAAPAKTAKATTKKTTSPGTTSRETASAPAPPARSRTKKDDHVEQPPVTTEDTSGEETDANGVFDKKFLEAQKKLLLDERAKYIRQADRLAAEAQSLVEEYEPGDVQFDDESGEGDTIAVERERDLALSAAAREAVTEIDAALARIENGTYGLSVVSGKPIPKERLKAIPWASTRVEEKVGGLGAPRR